MKKNVTLDKAEEVTEEDRSYQQIKEKLQQNAKLATKPEVLASYLKKFNILQKAQDKSLKEKMKIYGKIQKNINKTKRYCRISLQKEQTFNQKVNVTTKKENI